MINIMLKQVQSGKIFLYIIDNLKEDELKEFLNIIEQFLNLATKNKKGETIIWDIVIVIKRVMKY